MTQLDAGRRTWRCCSTIVGMLIVLLAVAGHAQAGDISQKFSLSLGVGVMSSGDILRVENTGPSSARRWDLPLSGGTFTASRFVLTLDEGPLLSPVCVVALNDRFLLNASLAWSEVDITAESLTGEVVDLVLYDEMSFLRAGLTTTMKLYNAPSYAFVKAGLSLVRLDAKGMDAFDQTGLGMTCGVGYYFRRSKLVGLQAEIRDTIMTMEPESFDPASASTEETEYSVAEQGPQHFVEVLLAVSINL